MYILISYIYIVVWHRKFDMQNNILLKNYIKLYLTERLKINREFPIDEVVKIIKRIFYTYKNDGYLYVAGNGGGTSAAEVFAVYIITNPFVSENKKKND